MGRTSTCQSVVDGSCRIGRAARIPAAVLGHSRRPAMGNASSDIPCFLERDSSQQKDILDGPIRTGDFVRHTRDGESREKFREAFNTPLYPMILVANEVMQEGLSARRPPRHGMEPGTD
jgi:hypothetical protein